MTNTKKTSRNEQIVALVKGGIKAEDIGKLFPDASGKPMSRQRVCYIARQSGVRRRDWGPGQPRKPGPTE
jgi:hypothetical protein